MVTLAEHVRRYVPLTDEDERRLFEAASPLTIPRRGHLFQTGEPGRFLVFVESGLLRQYSLEETKERTHQFALEGWWMADWEAFERGVPARLSMQAVEAAAVRVLAYDRYEPLLTGVPALERYFRRVYQRAYAASQRRQLLNETSSGETMYRDFQQHYPDFVQRVPQYMLASFLGFTPEFLSKIRARRHPD